MREIKFRGWFTPTEPIENEIPRMIYFDKLDYCDEYNHLAFEVAESSLNPQGGHYSNLCAEIEDFKLMQYTGLKDSKGKEIYEGDICEFVISEGQRRVNPPEALTVIVEIKNLTPGFTPTHPEEHVEEDQFWQPFWCQEEGGFWSSDYFTVIGNIYETPDLLKK